MPRVSRRNFLKSAAALTAASSAAPLAVQAAQPAAPAPRFRLGIVTYNIAAGWDVPTILRVCRNVGLAAVELRTTHKHGVEPTLSARQRQEVRARFADAGVQIWGCGTVCEFHSPGAAVVRRNSDTCLRFIRLVAGRGGRGVKVRPNALPPGVPVQRTLEQIGRRLAAGHQRPADAGVEVWVE